MDNGADCTPSELQGPLLWLLLGPRSSSSERPKQGRLLTCAPSAPSAPRAPNAPNVGSAPG
eukprot:9147732-Alexandrium_andersonii.AAC.1